MAITLVETPGAADANTYGTLEEADAYFVERPNADAWTALLADDEVRKALLIGARLRIDQEDFDGIVASSDQPLPFPRIGIVGPNGYAVESTVIPEFLKRAQFEMALDIANGNDPFAPSGLEAFSKVKVDVLELTMRAGMNPDPLPQVVRRELRSVLATVSSSQIRLRRGS